MNKNIYIRFIACSLAVLIAMPPWAFAQDNTANPGPDKRFRQEELDQMLAPIALYPDPLLAQVLVAATYPVQVTEADRWVKQNGVLKGDALNNALDRMDWDLSVKALVPFPQVLAMMDDKIAWTERLGDAFIVQQSDVMDTIQKLRLRAQAQGNIRTTREQTVVVEDEYIAIEPANPELVYVPRYDPAVIYGSWWYPDYPPYAWYPYFPADAVITYGLLGFASGILVASAWSWGWGHWDWRHRDIDINITRNININRNRIGAVRTSSWGRDVSRQRLNASRRFGSRDAGGFATGTRPSAAAVQRGLQQRQGGLRSGQAGSRSAQRQANRNSMLGRNATGRTGSGFANAAPRGTSRTGSSFSGRTSRSGDRFAHGNTAAPRGGSAFSRGSNRPRGGSIANNSGRATGGGFARSAPRSFGGSSFARGGGNRPQGSIGRNARPSGGGRAPSFAARGGGGRSSGGFASRDAGRPAGGGGIARPGGHGGHGFANRGGGGGGGGKHCAGKHC